jgi:hypothetical protein
MAPSPVIPPRGGNQYVGHNRIHYLGAHLSFVRFCRLLNVRPGICLTTGKRDGSILIEAHGADPSFDKVSQAQHRAAKPRRIWIARRPWQSRGPSMRDFRSMNAARLIKRSICLKLATLLLACHHAPYLPSRPIAQMFPRASSPPPTCPGQYRTTVENDNGTFFMGCWGNKTN